MDLISERPKTLVRTAIDYNSPNGGGGGVNLRSICNGNFSNGSPGHCSSQDGSFIQDEDMHLILEFGGLGLPSHVLTSPKSTAGPPFPPPPFPASTTNFYYRDSDATQNGFGTLPTTGRNNNLCCRNSSNDDDAGAARMMTSSSTSSTTSSSSSATSAAAAAAKVLSPSSVMYLSSLASRQRRHGRRLPRPPLRQRQRPQRVDDDEWATNFDADVVAQLDFDNFSAQRDMALLNGDILCNDYVYDEDLVGDSAFLTQQQGVSQTNFQTNQNRTAANYHYYLPPNNSNKGDPVVAAAESRRLFFQQQQQKQKQQQRQRKILRTGDSMETSLLFDVNGTDLMGGSAYRQQGASCCSYSSIFSLSGGGGDDKQQPPQGLITIRNGSDENDNFVFGANNFRSNNGKSGTVDTTANDVCIMERDAKMTDLDNENVYATKIDQQTNGNGTAAFISTDSLDFSSLSLCEENLRQACATNKREYVLTFDKNAFESGLAIFSTVANSNEGPIGDNDNDNDRQYRCYNRNDNDNNYDDDDDDDVIIDQSLSSTSAAAAAVSLHMIMEDNNDQRQQRQQQQQPQKQQLLLQQQQLSSRDNKDEMSWSRDKQLSTSRDMESLSRDQENYCGGSSLYNNEEICISAADDDKSDAQNKQWIYADRTRPDDEFEDKHDTVLKDNAIPTTNNSSSNNIVTWHRIKRSYDEDERKSANKSGTIVADDDTEGQRGTVEPECTNKNNETFDICAKFTSLPNLKPSSWSNFNLRSSSGNEGTSDGSQWNLNEQQHRNSGDCLLKAFQQQQLQLQQNLTIINEYNNNNNINESGYVTGTGSNTVNGITTNFNENFFFNNNNNNNNNNNVKFDNEFYINGQYIDLNHNEIGFKRQSSNNNNNNNNVTPPAKPPRTFTSSLLDKNFNSPSIGRPTTNNLRHFSDQSPFNKAVIQNRLVSDWSAESCSASASSVSGNKASVHLYEPNLDFLKFSSFEIPPLNLNSNLTPFLLNFLNEAVLNSNNKKSYATNSEYGGLNEKEAEFSGAHVPLLDPPKLATPPNDNNKKYCYNNSPSFNNNNKRNNDDQWKRSGDRGPAHVEDWDSLAVLLPDNVVEACQFFRQNSDLLRSSSGKKIHHANNATNNIDKNGSISTSSLISKIPLLCNFNRYHHHNHLANQNAAKHRFVNFNQSPKNFNNKRKGERMWHSDFYYHPSLEKSRDLCSPGTDTTNQNQHYHYHHNHHHHHHHCCSCCCCCCCCYSTNNKPIDYNFSSCSNNGQLLMERWASGDHSKNSESFTKDEKIGLRKPSFSECEFDGPVRDEKMKQLTALIEKIIHYCSEIRKAFDNCQSVANITDEISKSNNNINGLSAIGTILFDSLCPALECLLTDGLKERMNICDVMKMSVLTDIATKSFCSLVADEGKTSGINAAGKNRERSLQFAVFVDSLLSSKSLNVWVSNLISDRKNVSPIIDYYSPTSYLRLLASKKCANNLLDCLKACLSDFVRLPFDRLNLINVEIKANDDDDDDNNNNGQHYNIGHNYDNDDDDDEDNDDNQEKSIIFDIDDSDFNEQKREVIQDSAIIRAVPRIRNNNNKSLSSLVLLQKELRIVFHFPPKILPASNNSNNNNINNNCRSSKSIIVSGEDETSNEFKHFTCGGITKSISRPSALADDSRIPHNSSSALVRLDTNSSVRKTSLPAAANAISQSPSASIDNIIRKKSIIIASGNQSPFSPHTAAVQPPPPPLVSDNKKSIIAAAAAGNNNQSHLPTPMDKKSIKAALSPATAAPSKGVPTPSSVPKSRIPLRRSVLNRRSSSLSKK